MKKLIRAFLLFCVCSTFSSAVFLENLTFSEKDVELSSEIIEILENYHFTKKKYPLIKEDSLKEYFERLDPNRSIFLKKEVDIYLENEKLQNPYDQKTSMENAYEIFQLYQSRYKSRYGLQKKLLKKIDNLDLKQHRKLLRDRSKTQRSDSLDSLKKLWEDILINDVIQLLLNGNSLIEANEKLIKKLNNQFNYFNQTKSEDVLNLYLNSIALSFGPHSTYMSPKRTEDFDIDMRLSLEGIGALLTSDGMYTSISSLVPGGPAEKSKK